jgi:hypothetical protein
VFLRELGKPHHSSIRYEVHNDDLKGFLTSVPHEFIVNAAKHMVVHYRRTQPSQTGKPITFAIPTRIQAKSRIIRGKSSSKTTCTKTIFLDDIPELVRVALQFSHFTCLGEVYKQSRGAVIGGQASPALCALAVTYKEFVWQQAYKICTQDARFLCIRYVDNRLTVLASLLAAQSSFQRFLDPFFYQHPVELEPCGDMFFLGYLLDFDKAECLFRVPSQTHEYRSTRSAGSTRRCLSGFTARLFLLHRGTYPRSRIPPLVKIMIGHYVHHGFPPMLLHALASKVARSIHRHSNAHRPLQSLAS